MKEEIVKAQDTLNHLTGQEKKALAEYLRRLKDEYGYQPAADERPRPRRNSKPWEEQVDENTKLIIGMRLERCKDEAQFSEEEARHILNDAERFVARLEKYLRSVEAIE